MCISFLSVDELGFDLFVSFFKVSETNFSELIPSTIWGPVMADNDCIKVDEKLPDLDIGDWLVFQNMGAYSNVCARRMQGNSLPKFCAFVGQSTR